MAIIYPYRHTTPDGAVGSCRLAGRRRRSHRRLCAQQAATRTAAMTATAPRHPPSSRALLARTGSGADRLATATGRGLA